MLCQRQTRNHRIKLRVQLRIKLRCKSIRGAFDPLGNIRVPKNVRRTAGARLPRKLKRCDAPGTLQLRILCGQCGGAVGQHARRPKRIVQLHLGKWHRFQLLCKRHSVAPGRALKAAPGASIMAARCAR